MTARKRRASRASAARTARRYWATCPGRCWSTATIWRWSDPMSLRIAMTGATGFVGAETLNQALAAGHHVSAITRRAQPPRAHLKWVPGALEDRAALNTLEIGRAHV